MLTKIKLDEMEHYQIAANGIEPAGLERIAELLQESGIPAEIMEHVEPVWATKRGTFPKRLAKVLRRSGYAATPALLGAVGQAAADNTSRTDEYWFQIDTKYTDEESGFPYERGEHGDDNSCYHPGGQYAHAPYDIEESGGMLLRTFEPSTPGDGYYFDYTPGGPAQYYSGVARCFIIPCTYLADDDDYHEGLVMINGYCQYGYSHDLLHLARLVATAEGVAYRKVTVRDIWNRIYVNGDNGYLLGAWENIHDVRSVDIHIKDSGRTPSRVMHTCNSCNEQYDEEDLTVIGDDLICPMCLRIDYIRCERCGEWALRRITADVAGEWWCKHCTDTYSVTCARCGSRSPRAYAYYVGQECWCEDCYDQHAGECAKCGNYFAQEELSKENGRYFCRECSRLMCCACGETIENPIRVEGWAYCRRCAPV